MQNLVIVGQTVLEIYDCLTLFRTTTTTATTTTQADGPYDNRAKRPAKRRFASQSLRHEFLQLDLFHLTDKTSIYSFFILIAVDRTSDSKFFVRTKKNKKPTIRWGRRNATPL